MMFGYGMMGLFGLIGLLITVLIVVGIVLLVMWAVRRSTPGASLPPNRETPRDILQARYARGEITREQYQEMLKDLS